MVVTVTESGPCCIIPKTFKSCPATGCQFCIKQRFSLSRLALVLVCSDAGEGIPGDVAQIPVSLLGRCIQSDSCH